MLCAFFRWKKETCKQAPIPTHHAETMYRDSYLRKCLESRDQQVPMPVRLCGNACSGKYAILGSGLTQGCTVCTAMLMCALYIIRMLFKVS